MMSFTSSSIFNSPPSVPCPAYQLCCDSHAAVWCSTWAHGSHFGAVTWRTLCCPAKGFLSRGPTDVSADQAWNLEGSIEFAGWSEEWSIWPSAFGLTACTRSGIIRCGVSCWLRCACVFSNTRDGTETLYHLKSHRRHRGHLLTEETVVYPVSREQDGKHWGRAHTLLPLFVQ